MHAHACMHSHSCLYPEAFFFLSVSLITFMHIFFTSVYTSECNSHALPLLFLFFFFQPDTMLKPWITEFLKVSRMLFRNLVVFVLWVCSFDSFFLTLLFSYCYHWFNRLQFFLLMYVISKIRNRGADLSVYIWTDVCIYTNILVDYSEYQVNNRIWGTFGAYCWN